MNNSKTLLSEVDNVDIINVNSTSSNNTEKGNKIKSVTSKATRTDTDPFGGSYTNNNITNEDDDDNDYGYDYDYDDVVLVPAATPVGKMPVTIATIISSADADSGKSTVTNNVVDDNVYAYAKRILLAVNFVVESSRMEPFVAVYYIVFKEWNPTNFGVVSLVMSITMLVAQTPVGDILDKTTHKKFITAGAVFVAAITTTSVAWTSNFWIVVVIKAIEGLAATVFHLSLTLLIFGIARTKEEAPTFVAQTEVTNKIGSVLITLLCGLLAYFLYPNIASIFYLLGASGVIAAGLLLLIPYSAVDDNRARQLEEQDHENFDTNSETEEVDDMGLEMTTLNTVDNTNVDNRGKTAGLAFDEENVNNGPNINNENEELTAATYMHLMKDKNIAMFAVVTFVYHLANAGIQPLVAQHLAIENARFSMIFTSAVLLLNFLAQAITAQVMTKAVGKVDSKTLLVLAHLVLPIRCGLLAIMVRWWDNDYAILSTQLLDGIGAGIYDTMIPIVVSKFTVGTGRFGVVFGFIVSCWRVGGGFSYLLGETIWHKYGAGSAFLTQGAISIVSVVILVFGVTVPSYDEAKAKDIVRTPSQTNLMEMVSEDSSNVTASNRTPSQTNLLEMIRKEK